jgi:hypothetical protein
MYHLQTTMEPSHVMGLNVPIFWVWTWSKISGLHVSFKKRTCCFMPELTILVLNRFSLFCPFKKNIIDLLRRMKHQVWLIWLLGKQPYHPITFPSMPIFLTDSRRKRHVATPPVAATSPERPGSVRFAERRNLEQHRFWTFGTFQSHGGTPKSFKIRPWLSIETYRND